MPPLTSSFYAELHGETVEGNEERKWFDFMKTTLRVYLLLFASILLVFLTDFFPHLVFFYTSSLKSSTASSMHYGGAI